MNILIITKNLKKEKSAMDIRLDKIIEFLSKENRVYVLSYFGSIKKRKNIQHINMGKTSKLRLLNTFLYGQKIRRNIKKIIDKYNINVIYSQESIVINNLKSIPIIKIYDVLGLMQSESVIKDNSIEAKIKHLYYKKTENSALGIADYILTVNNAHKNKINQKNVLVLRDGVNKIFFKKYNKNNGKKIIVSFVGTFYRDRLAGILNVMPDIIKNNDNIYIEIIGNGRYVPIYKKFLKDKNCNEKITFHGHLKNTEVYKKLIKADICFSDDWSYIGFPTKVFEYMAMGKAILVENTPAVREIIIDKKNGLLYNDPEDFEKKITLLANDAAFRYTIGMKAKIDAKNHTWEIREKELNKILKKIKDENKL